MALNARAWQALIPNRGRPDMRSFLWFVWVRGSVNGLLPVARIGGEVASARLMIERRIGPATAVASIVVDSTIGIVTQFLVTIAALAVLAFQVQDKAIVARIGLGAALAIPIIALLLLVQRIGFFELLRRAREFLLGDSDWELLTGNPMRIDRAVRLLYRRRSRVVSCCIYQTAGWVAGSGEIYFFLLFLGHPVSLADAFVLEALAQALASAAFVVPGALGVQEGFMLFGQLLGLGPDTALALALARRVRDLHTCWRCCCAGGRRQAMVARCRRGVAGQRRQEQERG